MKDRTVIVEDKQFMYKYEGNVIILRKKDYSLNRTH